MPEFSCRIQDKTMIRELGLSIRVLQVRGDRVRLALTVPVGVQITRQQSPLCRAVGVVRDVK